MDYEHTSRGKSICPKCGYTWVGDHWLDLHLRKEHHRCPTCGALRVGLKAHQRLAHPEQA